MSKSVELKLTLSNDCKHVEGANCSHSPTTQRAHQSQIRLPPVDRGYAWVIVVGTVLFQSKLLNMTCSPKTLILTS